MSTKLWGEEFILLIPTKISHLRFLVMSNMNGIGLGKVVPVDGVVSRELGNGSVEPNVLVGGRDKEVLGVGGLVSEFRAISCIDAISVGSLEQSTVGPSHYEITMESIASGVTICKGEVGDVISVGAGVEEELVEEGEESNWV